MREIVLLGSTGSIGTQAVDIVRRNPGKFRLVALAAGGGNPELIATQAIEFGVEVVAVASQAAAPQVTAALAQTAEAAAQTAEAAASPGNAKPPLPKVLAGPEAVAELAAWPCDVVLNAVTGAVGLAATLSALDAGRMLALANKESLIMGGELVTSRAAPGQIVPVDSEHSAIAQCLRSGSSAEVRKLVLTASGGPFLHAKPDQLVGVTPAQALSHPTWNMGPVITINSATLVNKGLELIEAHLLFGIGFDSLEVVVHRQSVIHSMVEFTDGSTIAQASPPDMRIPIALSLAWPDRVPDAAAPVDWTKAHTWTFEPLDHEAFPAVTLAREAGMAGGTVPAAYNAANEECVDAFLAGAIPFTGIVQTVAQVISEHGGSAGSGRATGIDEILAADAWARARARELTKTGMAGAGTAETGTAR
ncbi:MAG TPA: 1-deoxy-D-xylulose-5-phosphate reductoisomerase [Streptosporangiaceae bacterium]|jgi:1-deoxy-D-xylulose 5-phosphate reductoisomerase|nr:1-deoxy-D-xylulose-5-phosphate reductoisomerase [Streptosporangiaceae bacterium]